MRFTHAAAVLVTAAGLLAPASAAQADPTPFGHACAPQQGVRFCPTPDLASRPTSFDGTPIDVDVTLPPTGDGPFPTILLLHGLGGDKTSFQSPGDDAQYTNRAFARRGFAVVQPTARGFAGSCGKPTAGSPGCAHGWTRLGDMRYEVRDIQTLTGQLVDEGIVNPSAVGATGISYGGGFSTMLAFLKDRIRLETGGYAPWVSPKGTPISLAAAWPRWLWTNGESIFTRNGRGAWSRTPPGVVAKSYAAGIFSVAFGANVAPTGGDLSTDVTLWKQQLDAGVFNAGTKATLDNAYRFHGVAGLQRAAGGPAPLLMQSGWTDALFPATQSLAGYDAIRKADRNALVSLQLADLGHGPGANHPEDVAAFDAQGIAFFDALLRRSGGKVPPAGSVTAFTMTCPGNAASGGGPYRAPSFARLARKKVTLRSHRTLRISSKGASKDLAAAVPGLSGGGALCTPHAPDRSNKAVVSGVSRGVTLLGMPVITGRVRTTGRNGQLDARVWDLNPKTHQQRLITRGAYRLTDDQRGRFRFMLDGNGWRFAKGHRIVVELLGRDDPTYGPSPTRFSAKLTGVKVALPVR